MFLDCERKPGAPERYRGDHAGATQKATRVYLGIADFSLPMWYMLGVLKVSIISTKLSSRGRSEVKVKFIVVHAYISSIALKMIIKNT